LWVREKYQIAGFYFGRISFFIMFIANWISFFFASVARDGVGFFLFSSHPRQIIPYFTDIAVANS
jgi:hypothetical protein